MVGADEITILAKNFRILLATYLHMYVYIHINIYMQIYKCCFGILRKKAGWQFG